MLAHAAALALLSAQALWWALAAALLLSAIGHPLYLILLRLLRGYAWPPAGGTAEPTVVLVMPVHGALDGFSDKLESLSRLDYPRDKLEVFLSLDGEVSGMERELARGGTFGLNLQTHQNPRRGKYAAINAAVEHSRGEIIVVSDLDACLEPDALRALAGAYQDPAIGAAGGVFRVTRSGSMMQSEYWNYESWVKQASDRLLGSATSANGTLVSIRREVFRPIPPGVVDDLYFGFCAMRAGRRFVVVPGAVALVQKQRKHLAGVFRAQRRIVNRGLRLLALFCELLNPLRHGRFAVGLFLHKVLRRLFPVFLLLFAPLSLLLAGRHPLCTLAATGLLGVLLIGLLAASWTGLRARRSIPKYFGLFSWFLFVNAGIFMGWVDFLRGKRVVKW